MGILQKNLWKHRIDSITYGLIYPAFFGNMVYDILNIYFEKDKAFVFTKFESIAISVLIMLFVVIDYMHLNGDVNTIYRKAEYKSRYYFLCDIITPFLLFAAFELIRIRNWVGAGVFVFCLTPTAIWIYKEHNPHSKIFFRIYAIVSFLIGLSFLLWAGMQSVIYIGIAILVISAAYFIYMTKLYPGKPRDYDVSFIKDLENETKDGGS
jgi:hypothetical protein